jgi:hypothetical protein
MLGVEWGALQCEKRQAVIVPHPRCRREHVAEVRFAAVFFLVVNGLDRGKPQVEIAGGDHALSLAPPSRPLGLWTSFDKRNQLPFPSVSSVSSLRTSSLDIRQRPTVSYTTKTHSCQQGFTGDSLSKLPLLSR